MPKIKILSSYPNYESDDYGDYISGYMVSDGTPFQEVSEEELKAIREIIRKVNNLDDSVRYLVIEEFAFKDFDKMKEKIAQVVIKQELKEQKRREAQKKRQETLLKNRTERKKNQLEKLKAELEGSYS